MKHVSLPYDLLMNNAAHELIWWPAPLLLMCMHCGMSRLKWWRTCNTQHNFRRPAPIKTLSVAAFIPTSCASNGWASGRIRERGNCLSGYGRFCTKVLRYEFIIKSSEGVGLFTSPDDQRNLWESCHISEDWSRVVGIGNFRISQRIHSSTQVKQL